MGKVRCTITLTTEILKWLDAGIDGRKIRSRSHYIELLLSEAQDKFP